MRKATPVGYVLNARGLSVGYVPVEQTVAIIEAAKSKPNYWWLLIIGVVPVVIGWMLRKKKQ